MVAAHLTTNTAELVLALLGYLCFLQLNMPQRVHSGKPRAAKPSPPSTTMAPTAPEPPAAPPSRLINHLTSVQLDLFLTDYQLSRLRSGCTSLPYNESLATIAMAHTIAKELSQDELGDMFQREVYLEYHDEATQNNLGKTGGKIDCLYGPVQRLCPSLSRVVIFRQSKPKTTEIPLMPNGLCSQCHLSRDVVDSTTDGPCTCSLHEPPVGNDSSDYFIHCLYDNVNACFVDSTGQCLYVKRDQLKNLL